MSLSPVTSQPPMHIQQPTSCRKYRQVEYYDGKDRCVAEYRRRPYVTKEMSSPTPSFRHHHLESKTKLSNILAAGSSERCVGDSKPSLMGQTMPSSGHVTDPKRLPKRRSKPVIIQTVTPSGVKEVSKKSNVEASDMPTPPPTPRIGRLSTPDIPDSIDAPFCDCCNTGHLVRYCPACETGLCRD